MRPVFSLLPWPTTGKLSAPTTFDGNQLVGLLIPNTIASTSLSFNTSLTKNITSSQLSIGWVPVADATSSSGANISVTIVSATAKYYGFSQDLIEKFSGIELIQFSANSSEVANQQIYVALIPRPSM